MLRLAIERPRHLDPALARAVPQSELVVADLLFDGLTAFPDDDEGVAPALAASWSADDGLRVWRFRLRDGATFADGRRVDAEAVVASFERILQAGASSPAGVLLQDVEEVGAPANDLVQLSLDSPLATLPEVLSSPLLGIVAPDAGDVGSEELDRDPVGSGPFALAGRNDDVIRLERSEGSTALLDEVELQIHDDLDDASTAVRGGDADWSLVPDEEVDEAGVHGTPFSSQLFYGLNLTSPDLGDRRLREAIVRAVDREAIVQDVYGGAVVAMSSPVGSDGDPCSGRCGHDPVRARELVEAAFPDGRVPGVEVDFDEGVRQREVASAIVRDLRAVGIPGTLRPTPFDDYSSFVAGGTQELFRLGWTAAYPSTEAYLEPLFASGSPENVVGLASGAVDDALRAARAEPDARRRAVKLAEAERRAMDEFPVVPLGQFQTLTRTADRVHGLTMSVTGTFDVTRVWLDVGSGNV